MTNILKCSVFILSVSCCLTLAGLMSCVGKIGFIWLVSPGFSLTGATFHFHISLLSDWSEVQFGALIKTLQM